MLSGECRSSRSYDGGMEFSSGALHRRDWLRTFVTRRSVRHRRPSPRGRNVHEAARKHRAATGGELGFGSLHLESGERMPIRRRTVSMASVYKLPIALTVLDLVDRRVDAREDGAHPALRAAHGFGHGFAFKLVGTEGYDFTVRQFWNARSKRATTPLATLLRVVGSPAVTARMAALASEPSAWTGRIGTTTDFVGVPSTEPAEGWTLIARSLRHSHLPSGQHGSPRS